MVLYGGGIERVLIVCSHAYCHMRVINMGLQVKKVHNPPDIGGWALALNNEYFLVFSNNSVKNGLVTMLRIYGCCQINSWDT